MKNILKNLLTTLAIAAVTVSANPSISNAVVDPANQAFFNAFDSLQKKQQNYSRKLQLGGWQPKGSNQTLFKPNERSKLYWTWISGKLDQSGKPTAIKKISYHFHVMSPENFSSYELAVYDKQGNLLTRSVAKKGEASVTLNDVKYTQQVAVQITVLAPTHKGGLTFFSSFVGTEPDLFGNDASVGDPASIL